MSIILYLHNCTNKSYYCDDRHSSVIAHPVEIPSNMINRHRKIVPLSPRALMPLLCWGKTKNHAPSIAVLVKLQRAEENLSKGYVIPSAAVALWI